MTIAAAIRITSPNEVRVIEHAAAFARQHAEPCFVISVVPSLPYGSGDDEIVVQGDIQGCASLFGKSHCEGLSISEPIWKQAESQQ